MCAFSARRMWRGSAQIVSGGAESARFAIMGMSEDR